MPLKSKKARHPPKDDDKKYRKPQRPRPTRGKPAKTVGCGGIISRRSGRVAANIKVDAAYGRRVDWPRPAPGPRCDPA